tara:strand:+ start:2462 stop:2716 length:255 start_codon:yes stop_codon:yes gene_type:complete
MAEKKSREYKEGKIILFPNTDKEGKQPDFTGWGMFKGEEFEVSIWNNVSQAGNNYKSGDVKIPYVAPEKVETKPVETETEIDPF